MLELNQMPLLPGQAQNRTVTQVDGNELNKIGINGGAFAVHKGDVIQFPDEDPLVVSQKVNDSANSPLAYYVGVIRNGEKSWLPIGTLTRRDAKGLPLGKFQEEMLTKPSFKEMWNALKGKTIKGGEPKEYEFAVFENGIRTDKTRTRSISVIEYAQ